MRITLEVAVETVEDAVIAAGAGADRLELCAALAVGGLTPAEETVRAVLAAVSIPVVVMVRPRGGGFVYSPAELVEMVESIRRFHDLTVAGFVFGALTPDGDIDTHALAELCRAARLRETVFHRAFDTVREPLAALDTLWEHGITRVLTSGPFPTAGEGIPHLRQLVERAGDCIQIMPGGGAKAANARAILDGTGCAQLHGRFAVNGCTSAAEVRAVRDVLDSHTRPA